MLSSALPRAVGYWMIFLSIQKSEASLLRPLFDTAHQPNLKKILLFIIHLYTLYQIDKQNGFGFRSTLVNHSHALTLDTQNA
jgi:hypothetical protein